MKNRKKFATGLLTMVMAIVFTSNTFAALPGWGEEYANQTTKKYEQKFTDVDKSYWAFQYISEMSERGVIAGYPNNYYYPNNNVTRAEFAKIMALAAGLPINSYVSSTTYADVNSTDWFAPYVEAARYYLSGYTSSGNLYYLPNETALREDIAVALVKLKGYDTSIYDESILRAMFTDWQSISDGARKYVAVAVENGLISGYEDNTFRGQNGITRAEAATLLWRAYQYGNGNKVFENEVIDKEPEPIPEKKPEPVNDYDEEDDEPTFNLPDYDDDYEDDYDEPEYNEPAKPEYLYEVSTIASNVTNLRPYSMCTDNNGTVYYLVSDRENKNTIMMVSKDGNMAEKVMSGSDIEPLCDTSDWSKAELRDFNGYYIYRIGFNQNDNCLYAFIESDDGFCVYNVITDSVLYEVPSLSDLQTSDYSLYTGMSNTYYSYSNLVFDNSNNVYNGNYRISSNNTATHIDYYNSPEFYLWIDNTLVKDVVDKDGYVYLDSRSGEWVKLDTSTLGKRFILSSGDKLYGIDNDNIYSMDLDENDKLELCADDVDNIDGKVINFNSIKKETSFVDADGVIYYWDVNYNAIRQIKKVK